MNIFFKTPDLNTQIRSVNILNFEQIIGMHATGMSFKAIGRQMGYHYTVVSRLVGKHTQTNNVKDLPRSGRPWATSDRDDRLVLKFQPRRAKHHVKRDRRCLAANSGRLMTLRDLSRADFRRFLTVFVDRRLLGSQCFRIWVVKFGVLKHLFILNKHGTKADIRSTKMANNRHAYNRDVLQSYWTSDGLPLY
jgi:hypothetical protein